MKIIVTGGAGFIGSAVVRYIINHTQDTVINLDKLTYAGNLNSLNEVSQDPRYIFEHADICDQEHILSILEKHKPQIIMHLAAESHVDRSIDGPGEFINTNIIGTFKLLEASRHYFSQLSVEEQANFKFHHISTDEVYGDLEGTSDLFKETNAYCPSSPYSASKAASDHLVRAWFRTFKLPALITNCSNNYGPFHFPEKLIPLMILNAMAGNPLPVYGDGKQIRDWLYVEDHAKALYLVASKGKAGETYNIGGHNEKANIEVVHLICELLEEFSQSGLIQKPSQLTDYKSLIKYVTDRPGHDKRYAIDASKIQKDLGWKPEETFETGLRKTVLWYINRQDWVNQIKDGSYRDRLGLG